MNIFGGTIKSRVMRAINARVLKAEKEYEDECKTIDQKAETEKAKAADRQVDAILGKVL